MTIQFMLDFVEVTDKLPLNVPLLVTDGRDFVTVIVKQYEAYSYDTVYGVTKEIPPKLGLAPIGIEGEDYGACMEIKDIKYYAILPTDGL